MEVMYVGPVTVDKNISKLPSSRTSILCSIHQQPSSAALWLYLHVEVVVECQDELGVIFTEKQMTAIELFDEA